MKNLWLVFVLSIFASAYTYNYSEIACSNKHKCSQMTSCKEAYFYLEICGVKKLNSNNDGISCEKIYK